MESRLEALFVCFLARSLTRVPIEEFFFRGSISARRESANAEVRGTESVRMRWSLLELIKNGDGVFFLGG